MSDDARAWVNLAVDAVTALGTVAVAIVAVWSDRIRAWAFPVRAAVGSHNPAGTLTRFGHNQPVLYHHLSVYNGNPKRVLRNCRVLLTTIWRRHEDGHFKAEPLPVPLQFVWAPADFTPTQATITTAQVLDFGFLVAPAQPNGITAFQPALYVVPNDFRGIVRAGDTVRFGLTVEAEDYVSPEPFIVEVAWDGTWVDNLESMSDHLRVTAGVTVPVKA